VGVAGTAAWRARSFELKAEQLTVLVGQRRVLSIDPPGSLQLAGTPLTVNGVKLTMRGAQLETRPVGVVAPGSVALSPIAPIVPPADPTEGGE
jgi:hypothetical protein